MQKVILARPKVRSIGMSNNPPSGNKISYLKHILAITTAYIAVKLP